MRKAALSLALFFAVAISSPAQTTYYHYSQPWNSAYGVPCANRGAGEVITFHGTTQTTVRQEIFPTGQIVRQYDISDAGAKRARFTITGVGQTGIPYEIVTSETFTGENTNGGVDHGVDDQNWTANGGGHRYQFHWDYKYTYVAATNITTYSDVHFFWLCG